jgi:hypothetical protein
MESLVAAVKLQEDRKKKMYSFLASLFVFFVFGYIIAALFVPMDDEDSSMDDEGYYPSNTAPKFLIPFNGQP